MKSKTIIVLLSLLFSYHIDAQTDLIFKSDFQFVPRFNDTGITWAGEYQTGNNADCTSTTITSPQDCNTGRDATHNYDSDGHAGFSFTKLDASGNPLADQSADYATEPWACVRDNVTGLIWEVKTDDVGIHDKNNTYRWGGITRQGNFGTEFYVDWNTLVNGSNNQNLCGFNDWRVPTTQELMSIVDNSVYNPSIDVNYFPNTQSSSYWSASPHATDSSNAWLVDFNNGASGDYGYGYGERRDYRYVRLVRIWQ